MKNFTKALVLAVVLLGTIGMLNNTANSQTDFKSLEAQGYYPLRMIQPMVAPKQEYGIDAIISVGAFDNYQISSNAGFAETDICVNPLNPLNFVATDNRITGFSGGKFIYYTTDGGITWGSYNYPTGNQGDPVLACDKQGNFYMAVLNSGVLVAKSVNGGASWGGLTNIVSNANADKEWIWADQTTGATANNVYMAYVNFSTGASVDFWRSVNNGSTWSGPQNLGTGTPNPGPDVCSDLAGRVFVAWYNGGGTSVRVSNDGGATFAAAVNASTHSTPGSVNASGRNVLKTDIRVNGMPHIAADMTSGPFSGYIYDAYSTNPAGPDAADVYMTRSTDHGATWNYTTPVKVNDDPNPSQPPYIDQWMSDVSVDAQGRVWVMWWDSRNDPNNLLTDTYAACSTDGGVSFMPNIRVTQTSFNPATIKIFQAANHYYLGDYQGISGKDFTFPLYVGTNNSLQDFTAYLPDYGIRFSKAVDSVNVGSTSVERVIAPMMGPFSGTVNYSATVSPSPAPGSISFTWIPSNSKVFTGNPDSLQLNALVAAGTPQQLYTVTVTAAQVGGPRTHSRTYQILVGNFSGVNHNGTETPQTYNLFQNYPNPFNPSTIIYYSVPKATQVNMTVYDVLGRQVSTLVNNEMKQAGEYQVTFDGANMPSGIYYYKIIAGDYNDVRKMILIK